MESIETPLIAGNWKMNGVTATLGEIEAIARGSVALDGRVSLAVCPPTTLLALAARTIGDVPLRLGAQDCHPAESGAHTGDVSAEMVADLGAGYIIVGHSERRADHDEGDTAVNAKAQAAWRAGLTAIVCVGETEAERKAGRASDVVGQQLAASVPDGAAAANVIVAYEPVWAIGTGLTPTTDDVAEMHAFMRARLIERFGADANGIRLLYGGSVKPGNAAELLAVENVDGALVGGASLKADDFLGIANAVIRST